MVQNATATDDLWTHWGDGDMAGKEGRRRGELLEGATGGRGRDEEMRNL